MKKTLLSVCFICYAFIAFSQVAPDSTTIKPDTNSGVTDTIFPIQKPSSPGHIPKETGTVTGTVWDEKNKETLIGVSVRYDEGPDGTVTDIEGRYSLTLPSGFHVIDFTFIGYQNRSIRVKVLPGKTITEDISLATETKQIGIVTVTTSKYEKKLGEDIVSVEVLTPDFIESSNIISVDDALDKVPGVNMIGEQVNIRGGAGYSAGAASRVLMLLDGLPMVTPDDGNIEFSSLPLENLEQIEVIKGASSSLYGSSALNGVINLITANAKTEPYYKITLYGGLYNNPFSGKKKALYFRDSRPFFGGGSFAMRKKFKQFDIVLGMAYNDDAGHLLDNSTRRGRMNVKLRYRPEKVPGLTLGVNMNASYSKSGFFFLWGGWADLPEDSLDSSTYLAKDSLSYVANETGGKFLSIPFNVDPYITYFDKKNNMHSIKARVYFVRNNNTNGENTDAVQYYGEYTFHSSLKFLGLNFVTGASGAYSYINSEIFDKRKVRNGAVFLQMDKKFFNRLTFTLGMRAEMVQMDTLDLVAVPIFRAGVNYQLFEATYFRGSFGQGYRYPTVAEKFVNTMRSGLQVIANDSLEAESGWSAELGIKQGVKIGAGWIGYFDIAGFVTQYHNMIEFAAIRKDGRLNFQAQNVTEARISGFEVSALGQGTIFGVQTNFLVGYNYLVPIDLEWDDTSRSNMLNYRFRHSAKADVETSYKNVVLGITATFVSFMENIDGQIGAVNNIRKFREAHNKGDYVFDVRAGYNITSKAKASVIVKNVFNRQYCLRPGYFEPPRSYTVQLSYEF